MARAQRESIAEAIPASVDPRGMVEWLRQQPAFAEARLQRRAKSQSERQQDRRGQRLTTGFAALDAALDGGLPRGGITELVGASGRTSLALGMLGAATRRGEVVAWIDTANALDPLSIKGAGVCLERFLWIRPAGGNRLKQALKAADLVLDAGGFALLLVDLGDVSPGAQGKRATQTRSAWWVRLARRVEAADTSLVTLGETDSFCCTLRLECRRYHGAGFEVRARVARNRRGAPGNCATVSLTQPVD